MIFSQYCLQKKVRTYFSILTFCSLFGTLNYIVNDQTSLKLQFEVNMVVS
jgi:hypothetical protein